MQKEQLSDKEALIVFSSFILGSTLIVGIGGEAKNDAWIAGIIGVAMAIPMLLIYSRLINLYHGKGFFDVLDELLGKVLGKVVTIIYSWFAIHLGALVIHNFAQFIKTVALPETPIIISMIALGLVCIYAVRLGIEVISRTVAYFFPIIIFIIILVQLLSIPYLHFENLKPVLANGLKPVFKGAFTVFSFPFTETVLFLGLSSLLKTKKSTYKVIFGGVFFTTILILLLSVRNILILGNLTGSLYFPAHVAVSMVNIGDFIQRIEVTVAIVLVFNVFVKSSICLLVACKGIAKIFNLQEYRSVVIQTGLLMIFLSYIIYDNIMLMEYWAFKVYPYYAFPMEVIIPIMIWITAEIKVKKAAKLNPIEV